MNLFIKRHCSSLGSPNSKTGTPHLSNKPSRILESCKAGSLFKAINLLNSTDPSKISVKPVLYASLLQTTTKVQSFTTGLQIHAHVIKSGLETDRFVGNSLLSLYFKLGTDFNETRKVFDGLFVKDVISWTSMVSGYVKAGKPNDSIELFIEMLGLDVEPNGFTLSSVIKACSDIGNLKLGKSFHGMVISRGFDWNNVISCSLIDMYGKNHEVKDAGKVFDELLQPDIFSCTAVISAFTRNDLYEQALRLFYKMIKNHSLIPDGFTFGTVLTACGNLERLRQGKQLHGRVIVTGHCGNGNGNGNVVVESSIVDMYGKCGAVYEARVVFDSMSSKNSVSWSALLGGYCRNGNYDTVLDVFRKMEKTDIYSFGTVLRACAGLADVRHGKEVHCQYVRRVGWRDVIVESALVDLYSKCGCIDFGYRVFVEMKVKNLITWNSMICGLARNGRGGATVRIFDDMVKEGIRPDYISFIGVLFACSHAGLVDSGRKYFELMSEYEVKPGIEHYNCVVDLLGRAGLLEEAESLIENSDRRDDSSVWGVLLGACTTCCVDYAVAAERIAKKMMGLEPNYHLSYVLLANVYRAVGRWSDAVEIRRLMEERGVKKTRGKSWIESNDNLGISVDKLHLSESVGMI